MVGSFYTAGRGRNEEDGPPGPNHAQHPGFERGDRFRRREHLSLKAGPEAVDEDTGRPETRQLDDGSGTQLDEGAERHPLQVQTSRCDILTHVPRCDLEAGVREGCKELRRDQVDLPEIGQTGPPPRQKAVPDERTGVGVALDAVALHQNDMVLDRFAEAVPAIGRDRRHLSLKREIVRLRHQAARASERRFWRK